MILTPEQLADAMRLKSGSRLRNKECQRNWVTRICEPCTGKIWMVSQMFGSINQTRRFVEGTARDWQREVKLRGEGGVVQLKESHRGLVWVVRLICPQGRVCREVSVVCSD
jgi:hypothetical protein